MHDHNRRKEKKSHSTGSASHEGVVCVAPPTSTCTVPIYILMFLQGANRSRREGSQWNNHSLAVIVPGTRTRYPVQYPTWYMVVAEGGQNRSPSVVSLLGSQMAKRLTQLLVQNGTGFTTEVRRRALCCVSARAASAGLDDRQHPAKSLSERPQIR